MNTSNTQRPSYIWVFFTRSYPKLGRLEKVADWLIRAITQSGVVHVAVGDGEAVLSPAIHGNTFWPQTTFAMRYPGVVGAFIVQVDAKPDIDQHEDIRRKSILRSFLKHVTRGRVQTRDCVCLAKRVMAEGGYHIPANITSPIALKRYLHRAGHRYESFE